MSRMITGRRGVLISLAALVGLKPRNPLEKYTYRPRVSGGETLITDWPNRLTVLVGDPQ